ncbi:MAG TPA: globin domain-containing protein [Gemmatimonadales bacterium]
MTIDCDSGVAGGLSKPVRPPWALVASSADVLAARFHARLVALDPEVAALFAKTDPAALQRRLAYTFWALAESLDQPERLVVLVVPLGRRHAGYGVREEHYQLATEALFEALRDTLGPHSTPELEDQWRELMGLVTAVMERALNGERNPSLGRSETHEY